MVCNFKCVALKVYGANRQLYQPTRNATSKSIYQNLQRRYIISNKIWFADILQSVNL
jgi:hypothetical protein